MDRTSDGPEVTNVGVLGCGTVGSALCALLIRNREALASATGVSLQLTAIAVSDPSKRRDAEIPVALLTTAPHEMVVSPEVDIVVELFGGTDPALDLTRRALECGKRVVTANKELLAQHGEELFAIAQRNGTGIYFEAAVAGAIPLIRTLQSSLAGEPITRIAGILNGTTNYMLASMTELGTTYAECLAEAQSEGYAEADPTMDVDGLDAASKAAILARVAFGADMTRNDIHCEGISNLPSLAFRVAGDLGCVIKLLAILDRPITADAIVGRVFPMLVPKDHVLAAVSGAYNAVHISGEWVGDCMLYGHGAGPIPTSSALLGDIVAAAQARPLLLRRSNLAVGGIESLRSRFCIAADGIDEPGVLATIDSSFARNSIGLSSISRRTYDDQTRILITTKHCSEPDAHRAIVRLKELDVVDEVSMIMRFFDDV